MLTAALLTAACATTKKPTSTSSGGTVEDRCAAMVESVSYARKSVAGRVAATVVVIPLGVILGTAGAVVGMPWGFAIPFMVAGEATGAASENRVQFGHIREACLTTGGPEHVGVAEAIGSLALLRISQRNPEEAMRLYRDGVALIEQAPEEEFEGAVRFQLAAASAMGGYEASRNEGAALYARTLTMLETRPGLEYPELERVLAPYARLLRTLGRENEATALEARMSDLERADAAPSATDLASGEPCTELASLPCAR